MLTEDKIIYLVYKEFYNKKPDLTKKNRKNITIEIQAMVFILMQYGINLGEYSFSYSQTFKMPISIDLQTIIDELIDSNKNLETNIILGDYTKIMINAIGLTIINEINAQKNPIDYLRRISSSLYGKEYIIPYKTLYEISCYSKYSVVEIESINKLVKKIVLDTIN